jgi:hypothetical protein
VSNSDPASTGEHWWPVAAAILSVAALHLFLPNHFRIEPVWLTPVVLVTLVIVLVVGDPGRIDRQRVWLRVVIGVVIGAITLANTSAAVRLVTDIASNSSRFADDPRGLLGTGAVIWMTNVLTFALWYWDLDRGGAASRAHGNNANPAFIFPEMQHPDYVRAPWTPKFVDYLSLSFWTATAFSPTDTSAIKGWAKLLMMIEAAGSLALGTLVIARAVNIL